MTDAVVAESALVKEYIARLEAIRYEPIGHVARLVVSLAHDDHRCVPEMRIVPQIGVDGDHAWKQWWKGKRQDGREISAMSAEVLDALEIPYEVPGDNVIVRGFDLNGVLPGDTIRIGDMILQATGAPHRPCSVFERRTSGEKRQAIANEHWRGTMFDALQEGLIRVGDRVERIFLQSREFKA